MSISASAPPLAQRIRSIRGHKIMLDTDLAELYGVSTKALVQAVKRNRERFPSDFVFPLTDHEVASLRSQIVTSNVRSGRGGRRTAPYAFTEQGVAMLSSVLRSDQAVKVNVEIMRTFVRLRELIGHNSDLAKRLDDLESKYDDQFKVVFDAIRELMAPPAPPPKRRIGFVQGG
jgi:hypothetical protein